MGFHVCAFCAEGSQGQDSFSHFSSGDVILTFENGHTWIMPDMILHYISDHNWLPPREFISDVLHGKLTSCEREQMRGGMTVGEATKTQRVGYLTTPPKESRIPHTLISRLMTLIKKATEMGSRLQTKGP